MDKVVVKWQVANGTNFIKSTVEGTLLAKVVALGQKFENDVAGFFSHIGVKILKNSESPSPEAEIVTSFYMEEDWLTADYKLTVRPETAAPIRYTRVATMVHDYWMQKHVACGVFFGCGRKATRKDI